MNQIYIDNSLVWGENTIIDKSITEIRKDAEQKGILFEVSKVENLPANTQPPQIFIFSKDQAGDYLMIRWGFTWSEIK